MKTKTEKKEKIFSEEHMLYLKKRRAEAIKIKLMQFSILIFFISTWEALAYFKVIDNFIVSSPSRILGTIINLYCSDQLWNNISVTMAETLIGFASGTILGIIIASLIWYFPAAFKISQPYLVVLNALPKVALGPIIIVWMGASAKSIILMALLVSVILSIMSILQGFMNVEKNQILLMKSFGASKFQIFTKLVLPSNIPTIISVLKINIGMSLIGVITGEFLVSESGIGYLIVYGGQVFKMDLVMAGVIILAVLAWAMYAMVAKLENIYTKNRNN